MHTTQIFIFLKQIMKTIVHFPITHFYVLVYLIKFQ